MLEPRRYSREPKHTCRLKNINTWAYTMDGSKKNRGRTVYRNASGFLLLDSSFEPIYANDDAVQLLAYPKGPREIASRDGCLAEQLRSVLFNGHSSPREFLSGRRHCRCRAFSLDSHSTNPSYATAVLFERRPRGAVDVAHYRLGNAQGVAVRTP